MPEFTGQNDLRGYLRLIWRWKLLFLALLIAAPGITYLMERGKPKIYQSSALVSVSQNSVTTVGGAAIAGQTNLQALSEIMKTRSVAAIAGQQMNPPTSGSIANEVHVAIDPATNFMTFTATDTSPTRAAEIANAFAKALQIHLKDQAIQQINNMIAAVKKQLQSLAKNSPNYQTLNHNLSVYQAALGNQGSNATIIQAAIPNYTAVGPHVRRTVEIGAVIGLLLAFAAVMLAEGADRRMHSPDELEELTDLPLLAAIPPSAFSEDLDTGPIDEEAFQMLRTSLTYFTADRALSSVLITSPGEQEGKSTVAARLALVAANAGLDVILVDGDLRRGGASAKFAISAQSGLGAVLGSNVPVDSVMLDWPLAAEGHGRLRIVPAGPPPPNVSALISSARMRQVLAQLEERSDLVIVDSPAALAVSDAVPLMRVVSGLAVVARMNKSSKDTIGRLRKMIDSAGGTVLGVVATGVSRGGYDKYSHDYYGPVEHGRRGRRRKRRKKVAAAQPSGIDFARVQNGSSPHPPTEEPVEPSGSGQPRPE